MIKGFQLEKFLFARWIFDIEKRRKIEERSASQKGKSELYFFQRS